MLSKKLLSYGLILTASLLSTSVLAQNSETAPVITEPTEVGPGYMMISGWYKDAAVQSAYTKKVGPVIRKFDFVSAKIGVNGLNLSVLEGDWTPRGFSLLHFASETAVKKFWYSEEYQNEVKTIREGNSALDVIKAGPAFGTKPRMDNDSALLIFLVDLEDRERLMTEYVPYAPAIVAQYGGKFLISSAQWGMELLEGDFPSESIVVVEFPTGEALTEFWNDEEYKALSEIRKATGKWSVIEVMPLPSR